MVWHHLYFNGRKRLDQLEPAVEMIESVKDEDKPLKISSALNYAAPEYYEFTDRIDDISINLETQETYSRWTICQITKRLRSDDNDGTHVREIIRVTLWSVIRATTIGYLVHDDIRNRRLYALGMG